MITIKKEENGTYSARVRYKDAYGIVHQKRMNGYTRKKDLEGDYAKLIANSAQTIVVNKKDKQKTLLEVYKEWKQEYEKKVRYSTAYNLNHVFTLHAPQAWLDKPIANFKINEIQAFVDDHTKETNRHSMRIFVIVLRHIFKFAEKKYSIPNISKELVEPYIDKTVSVDKVRIIPPEVLKLLLENSLYHYQVLYQTLYRTGMRIGEALALTWDDIDFEKQTISITKSISKVKAENYSCKIGIGKTKNKSSIRTIGIDVVLLDWLKKYKEKFETTDGKFLWKGETPMYKENVLQYFKSKLKKAGIETRYTIHDFRHTHASLLLSKGIPITAVSNRLGHKNSFVTMSVYSHFIPSDEENVLNVIKNFELQ